MSKVLVAKLIKDYEVLSALATWQNLANQRLETDTPQLNLALQPWRDLQKNLLALNLFVEDKGEIQPTSEGQQFLVSLSEIYHGNKSLATI